MSTVSQIAVKPDALARLIRVFDEPPILPGVDLKPFLAITDRRYFLDRTSPHGGQRPWQPSLGGGSRYG